MEPFEDIIDLSTEACETNEVWLTTEEAAAYLKIDAGTLNNLICNGAPIPYYKLGRLNRYLKTELDKYLRLKPKGERPWESHSTS